MTDKIPEALAVLDKYAARLAEDGCIPSDLFKARAVFAELIEAAKRVIASDDAHETLHAPDGDDIARMVEFSHANAALRAALADVEKLP